jgi:hypothetical protein
MPPLMASGAIDGLSFIGGSDAADNLIRRHPHPHRLKVFLQLEGKNMGVRRIGKPFCGRLLVRLVVAHFLPYPFCVVDFLA